MLYTIKFTNTHKAINLDQIVKYDLSTISPTLIVDSTYVSHVSDQFDNTDDFISIPLYKRNQFCLLPANSSLTVETENSQEAIYYKQLTIDNCHIDVSDSSSGGGGGECDNEFVKMLLSNDFSPVNNTLAIPDYVQTIDASAITWSSKCSSLVMNNSLDITAKGSRMFEPPYQSQVVDIARFSEDDGKASVIYTFKEDHGVTYADMNPNLSTYIKDCDIDINSIENRQSFIFYGDDEELISEYENLFAPVLSKIDSVVTKPINHEFSCFYSTIHIQGNNYHVIFLYIGAETDSDISSFVVLDLTDTLPQDRENYIIFEWVEETKELRNSVMHEINYDRHEPVYAYYGPYPPIQTFDVDKYFDYTKDYISASDCIHIKVNSLTVDDNPGYLIKDNTKFIPINFIEPFCLCGDRTRLIISDNFKTCYTR